MKTRAKKKDSADWDIPVRITMRSARRESQARLFDAIYGDGEGSAYPDGSELTRLSQADEIMMGIQAEDDGRSEGGGEDTAAAKGETSAGQDGEDSMDLVTEGRMTCLRDPESNACTVTVMYQESELTGMEGSQSRILFRTDDPGLVHMIRTGTVSTALTFREHCRAICTYDTPYIPFQVGIHGLRVDNRLLSDGILNLDYIIEIRGGQAERCHMEMRVKAEQPEETDTP